MKPSAEFKSHSGLKVGETRPMLVRKVSPGVCEYAPSPAGSETMRKALVKIAYGGWSDVPVDSQGSRMMERIIDEMRSEARAALAKSQS